MRARRIAALALCLVAMLSFVGATALHPGRTDANGGHWNHATGEYHYHHGYPEHQHTNGVCPYEFDDKTGQNSGTSGGSGGTTSKKPQKEESKYAKSISVYNAPREMNEGDSADFTWSLEPLGSEDAYVKWSSSDTSVAKLDKTGKVIAISEGSAKIKGVAEGGATTSFNVKVKHVKTFWEKVWGVVGPILGIAFGIFAVPICCGIIAIPIAIVKTIKEKRNK